MFSQLGTVRALSGHCPGTVRALSRPSLPQQCSIWNRFRCFCVLCSSAMPAFTRYRARRVHERDVTSDSDGGVEARSCTGNRQLVVRSKTSQVLSVCMCVTSQVIQMWCVKASSKPTRTSDAGLGQPFDRRPHDS